MSDQNYPASQRVGSTIFSCRASAGYKKNFLQEKKILETIVPVTLAVTYLQADLINIRTYATGMFFFLRQ
jgi:hypothetical protein